MDKMGRSGSNSGSGSRLSRGVHPRRHQRNTNSNNMRGPLSLLWVSLFAVATGPAACLVQPLTSTRLSKGGRASGGGGNGFASAAPLQNLVLGTAHHGNTHWRGVSYFGRDGDVSSKNFGMYAVSSSSSNDDDGVLFTRRRWPPPPHAGAATATSSKTGGVGGVEGSTAVNLLSRGAKSLMNAAQALSASSTGVEEMGSRRKGGAPEAKRILILMSDTGGGHRASSEALSAALRNLYGDQVCLA